MKNIFFDMDGVLAEYRALSTERDMEEKGYFKSLKPEWNVLLAFKMLSQNAKRYGINIFVLTKVYPSIFKYSLDEKLEWKDYFMPFLNDENFVVVNGEKTEKSLAIKEQLNIDIDKNSFLIDDYNYNLLEWAEKGGTPIKYVNGINDREKSFVGFRLSYKMTPKEISKKLLDYIRMINENDYTAA